MVLVESTGILSGNVKWTAQRAERPTVNAVTVAGNVDIGPGSVNGAVNHKGSGIEKPALAAVNDLAVVVDQNEIGSFNQRESNSKWIDPEVVRVDGITEGNVALRASANCTTVIH